MNNCNNENFKNYLKELGETNPWESVANLAEKSGHYYDPSMEYVCEDDKVTLEQYNQYVGRKSEHKFTTNILPVPFEGDIFNAKIIILTLNPGFVEEVNHTLYNLLNEEAKKQITDYHIQNLRLQCKGIYPNAAVGFIGDRYWVNKTRLFREEYNFDLSEFALVQYIGYQSKEFNINKELKNLNSIEFTRLLMRYIIETRTDDYCFVIARNYEFWMQLLKELDKENRLKDKVVKLINYRNTTLSMTNVKDEYKPILTTLINLKKLYNHPPSL